MGFEPVQLNALTAGLLCSGLCKHLLFHYSAKYRHGGGGGGTPKGG